MSDPPARLDTAVRLRWAALLAVLPLGLVWSQVPGFQTAGATLYGYCSDGYCSPDVYLPGTYVPGDVSIVAQAPAGAMLVLAAIVLVLVSHRRRTARTRRLAGGAIGLLALSGLLAASVGQGVVLCLSVIALLLAAPPVLGRSR